MIELINKVVLIKNIVPHNDLLNDYWIKLAEVHNYKRFYARNYIQLSGRTKELFDRDNSFQDQHFRHCYAFYDDQYVFWFDYESTINDRLFIVGYIDNIKIAKIEGYNELITKDDPTFNCKYFPSNIKVYKYIDPIITLF